MKSSKPQFLEILRTLVRHGVDSIVVGGISAVLQGAPVTTFNLDVLQSRDAENIRRLLVALDELDATGGRQLLHLLDAAGKSRTCEDLMNHCGTMEIEPGTTVRVLDLETLIAVKEELGAPKDIAVLPVLREAAKERKAKRAD